METNKEKVSYCIGLETGRNIKGQFADMDADKMIKGFQDSLLDSPPKLSQEEVRAHLIALQKQIEQQQKEYVAKVAKANQKAGEAFLSENKNKEGVETLPSGLQFKVIESGKGDCPINTDIILMHYEGKFLDGAIFDSSYKRGKPQLFPVNQLIPGWSEIVQKMKAGDKWEVVIPSYLAYGELGFGRDIPPNSTLLFDMELIEINPKRQPPKS